MLTNLNKNKSKFIRIIRMRFI